MNGKALRLGLVGPIAATVALALACAAHAEKPPVDPVEKRFQDIEKQLKQLRSIVIQARDTGQPVAVRLTSDPDPEVEALSMRVDDMEQAARSRNDQIDSLTHDLETARKADADDKAQIKALEDRLVADEAKIKAIDDAQRAAANPPPPVPAAGAPGQEADAGAVPPPPQPPPSGDPAEAFKHANALLHQGYYAQASSAFSSFVDTYGDTPYGPEARYWLGETLLMRGLYTDAAAAYIGAIRGYPQTTWAPDAMVKLSKALIALNKPEDACHALDELARRYPAAPPLTKAKARDVRAAAKCGA